MFKFTDDCMIGIKEIDDEHRMLFKIINEAIDFINDNNGSSKSLTRNLLNKLQDYAKIHFAHEEAYMEETGDAELEYQKAEHRKFSEKINSYHIENLTDDNCNEIAKELLSFAAKWLYRHILGSDIMIGKFKNKPQEDAFAFTDKYKTGIKLIDDEHQKLFEIVKETDSLIHEQLLHDKYDRIVHILKELADYTKMHFSDEEKYMEEINYSGLEMQRIAHAAFIDHLSNVNIEDLDDNQEEYLEELIDFLLVWLTNHILKMDKKIPQKPALPNK